MCPGIVREQFDLAENAAGANSSSFMTEEKRSVPLNSRRQQSRNNHNLCSTGVTFVAGS